MQTLKGKVILITGASRGLGRACAERLMEKGYRVVGLARKLSPGAPFEIRAADVTNPASVCSALADLRRSRDVYALVNGAGIASMNLVVTTPLETIRRIVDTNLLGTIYCCVQIAPALIRRREGRIINFSSIAVPLGLKGEAVYAASKAGVEGFSRAFAREMADHGVTVNVIAPGPVDTDLIAKVPPAKIQSIIDSQVIQRKATTDDVAGVVDLILSREAGMLTGQVFHIGGI